MIISLLFKKNIIPRRIYLLLLIILGLYALIKVFQSMRSIMLRDNMNYQEYNWNFKPASAPSNSSDVVNTSDPWGTPYVTCIGQSCCYTGSTYDSSQNKCIPNTTDATESFVNDIFTKHTIEYKKPDVTL